MNSVIIQADYHDRRQAKDIGRLLDQYASDPMGGGAGLDPGIKARIADELAKVPGAFSVLAYMGEEAVGLVNCFTGFSTFQCRPLVNIHDVVVLAEHRGQGISGGMLEKVEEIARERGACKLTLEVLEGNQAAQQAYRKAGFSGYELDPQAGKALFWQKLL